MLKFQYDVTLFFITPHALPSVIVHTVMLVIERMPTQDN